jgi:hypothetical protein
MKNFAYFAPLDHAGSLYEDQAVNHKSQKRTLTAKDAKAHEGLLFQERSGFGLARRNAPWTMQGAARFAIPRQACREIPSAASSNYFLCAPSRPLRLKLFLTHPNQARPCKHPRNRSVYQYPA